MECQNEKQIMIKTVDKKEIIITGNYTDIGELMTHLEKEHSYRRDCQQLIFTGKILKENDTIPEMNAQSFLVLLMKKPKVTMEETKEDIKDEVKPVVVELNVAEDIKDEVKPAVVELNVAEETKNEETVMEESNKEHIEEDNVVEPSIPENPLNNIEPNQEMVENLMTMGFDVNDIKMILTATNNNMEMTGAILMEPAMLEEIKTKLANGENPFANPMNNSNNGRHPGELTEEQVMEMMEQNPQAFQQLLAKIVEQQPEIANLVQSDPQSFISLLTKFLNQSGMFANRGMEPGHHTDDMGGMPETSQQPQIEMNQEEKTLIDNLQPMFPHLPTITILETLRACGNNEEMTANLLFEY